MRFEQTFKNIDDALWKEAGCGTELDYTEQTSWSLFLKHLDDLEQERAMAAELVGKPYDYLLDDTHRWSRWAVPKTAAGSPRSNRKAGRSVSLPTAVTLTGLASSK